MAQTGFSAQGTGLRLTLRIDDLEKTSQAFREIRRDVNQRLGNVVQEAAERTVLPTARRKAGHLKVAGTSISSSLVVRKGRRNSAVLTSSLRGVKARAVGLMEFGGTVKGTILPKAKRRTKTGRPPALMIRGGHPIAKVTTPRHYRARRFMLGARDERLAAFGQEARDMLVQVFRPYMDVR